MNDIITQPLSHVSSNCTQSFIFIFDQKIQIQFEQNIATKICRTHNNSMLGLIFAKPRHVSEWVQVKRMTFWFVAYFIQKHLKTKQKNAHVLNNSLCGNICSDKPWGNDCSDKACLLYYHRVNIWHSGWSKLRHSVG